MMVIWHPHPLTREQNLLVDESGVVSDPALVSVIEELPNLETHIGLHAWRLTWRGRTFTAPPDWEQQQLGEQGEAAAAAAAAVQQGQELGQAEEKEEGKGFGKEQE